MSIIDRNQWWILALSYSNSNPTILVWILDRNYVTNMHICNHVFKLWPKECFHLQPCVFLDFWSKKRLVATKHFIEFSLFGDHENVMQPTCIFYDSHYSLILKAFNGCRLFRDFLQLVIKKCLAITKHFLWFFWNGDPKNT